MTDSKVLLSEIESCIRKGENEKVEVLLSDAPFVEVKDPIFHKKIAKILSALGKDHLSKREYELSLRDGIADFSVYLTLADLYMEHEEPQKAISLLRRGIELFPKEEELYMKLGSLYEARGEIGALELLYKLAYENTKNPFFREKKIGPYAEEETTLSEPRNIHITKFVSLFRGREGVYARQWVDSKGNTGYSPIREPLTLKVAKNHLLGNYTIGVYQLREDNTIEFIAFDIDVSKKFLKDYFSSEKIKDQIIDEARDIVTRLLNFLTENGIKTYVEDSGFKGYHVWIFLDKPLPSVLGRIFGLSVLKKLEIEGEMIHVEVFPKQAALKRKEGLGNLIKLPLGIHRRSGRRSLFLDKDFNPVDDQLSFLLDIEKTEKDQIVALSDSLKDHLPPVELIKESILEEEKEFVIEDDREFNLIIRRCPVIGALWDKVNTGAGLNNDESMVVIFTLGHLANGPKIVNTILRKAGVFNERSYLKSKLKGYPMGCPKIRKKIPYITLNTCKDCFSGEELGTYPNPLLHLREFEKEDKDVEILVFEYVELLKKYEILKNKLLKAKDSILSYMDERGLNEIEVKEVKIERTEDGNDLYIRTGGNTDKET